MARVKGTFLVWQGAPGLSALVGLKTLLKRYEVSGELYVLEITTRLFALEVPCLKKFPPDVYN
jgi:hypothetical protein